MNNDTLTRSVSEAELSGTSASLTLRVSVPQMFFNNARLNKQMSSLQPPYAGRQGLSLLEVMLALAILGVSLATIGELMRIGSRNAEMARDLTTAQILCETKMAEVVTGMVPALTASAAPMTDIGSGNDWLYAIETQTVGQEGLLSVRVVVQQNPDLVARPASFALVRWMIDPNSQTTTSSTSATASGSSSTSS